MPPPLTDSEESDDNYDDPSPLKYTMESADALYLTTETELDCNQCTFYMEPPIQMHDSDQVFISQLSGEVLIYPKNEAEDEEWIQKYVIDQDSHKQGEENVLYAKGDTVKLEKFLKQEQNATVRIIKKMLGVQQGL